MKDKKILKILIGVAIVLILGIIVYGVVFSGKSDKAGVVERYTLPSKEYVFINGVYKPKSSRTFETNQAKGIIDSIGVQDGQDVEAGQAIITYRNDEVTSQISELGFDIETMRKSKTNDYNVRKNAQSQRINARNQMIEQAKKTGQPVDYSQLPSTEMDPTTNDFDTQIEKMQRQINSLKNKQYKTEFTDVSGKAKVEKITAQDGSKETRITIRSTESIVEGTVKEKDLNKIASGMEGESLIVANDKKLKSKIDVVERVPSSEMTSSAQPGLDMSGMMGSGSSSSSDSSSEYKVNIVLLEDNSELAEGFHIQTKVDIGGYQATIPKSSVIEDKGKKYVFVIKSDNKLTKKEVKIKNSPDKKDEYIVREGLNERDEIVKNPNQDMKEGDIIE